MLNVIQRNSVSCFQAFFEWNLNMQISAAFLQDPSTRLETNGDGELVPQRRERYVFRPILIKILETFFAETPFPDYNKRAEIASACNSALQMDKKGESLNVPIRKKNNVLCSHFILIPKLMHFSTPYFDKHNFRS